VGGFDESFFMYFEDADLCYRLGKVGWEVHFAPVTTIVHVGGASTEQSRADMAVQLLESTKLFYERHSSPIGIAVMKAIVTSLMLAKWVGGKVRLAFTRDAEKCGAISERIAVCEKVLFGNSQNH
jgi:GT2 family glycosyltransferase